MRYEWVLLDADGTLFDYESAESHALRDTLEDVGLPADEAALTTYRRINGALWRAFERGETTADAMRVDRWVGLLDELDAAHDAQTLADAYIAHLAASAQLLPGAAEVTRWLADRFRLGLITNGLADVQHPRVALSGLGPLFEVVVISDEIGVSKPHAGYFDVAFARMAEVAGERPDPAACLVVGDNVVADVGGGAAYGCDTCWVNPAGASPPPDVHPTHTVASVADLRTILV